MNNTPTPSLEVFTPVQAAEFPEDSPEHRAVAARIEQVTNDLFGTIEREVLPAPDGATTASETVSLLRALPLESATYDIAGDSHILTVTSSFNAPFATPEEWGERIPGENIDPVVEVKTRVTVTSDQLRDDNLWNGVQATRQWDRGDEAVSTQRSLMGIKGKRVVRGFGGLGAQYNYTAAQQAEIRKLLGEAIAWDETARVDAQTEATTRGWLGGLLVPAPPSLDLRSQRKWEDGQWVEPTPLDRVAPTLRVVRALIERSTEAR